MSRRDFRVHASTLEGAFRLCRFSGGLVRFENVEVG